MEYTKNVLEGKKIILVRISGEMTKEELAALGVETRIQAKELQYGIIFDFRLITSDITYSDVFFWLAEHYNRIDPKLKNIPVAHISNENDANFFGFVETAFRNNGANVHLFRDEALAIEWLDSLLATWS